ncbi:MAG: outer membrane lipoprotein-sorting protein [Myxococcaceae bacterium]|jgi:outer membrane lipoprotein-sorting protein|nr:outer membrane lipoprotein-sorting protein [Myxococcaceae bacterium]
MTRLLVLSVLVGAALPARAMDKPEMVKLLAEIDDRQRNGGDYKALVYLEQKEKDKADIVREVLVYRRDADDKLMLLFSKPKSEEGKGVLRLDKNLWTYDPGTGKWDRTTERERIGGTNTRRADFDESRLADEFEPSFVGEEKLGKFETVVMELKVKEGFDVAYPVLKLWVDKSNHNILKRQEFALSGKLARTSYYPKWQKLFSESKKAELWFPGEIRIFDEIEKSNSTLVLFKTVDLNPLDQNMFTKAWLESKSR